MRRDTNPAHGVRPDRRPSGGLVRRVRAAADRFRRSRDGAVAVMFAFAIVPVLGMVGGAVDCNRSFSPTFLG